MLNTVKSIHSCYSTSIFSWASPEKPRCPARLDAIATGFVEGLPRLNVGLQLFILHLREGDQGLLLSQDGQDGISDQTGECSDGTMNTVEFDGS